MTSTLYTIGTVLGRAKDSGHAVDVLVEGHWLSGRVMLMDGQGVVLDGQGHDHAVIRIDRIAVVRMSQREPADAYALGSEADYTATDDVESFPYAPRRGPDCRCA